MAIPKSATLKDIRAGVKRAKDTYRLLSFGTRKSIRSDYKKYVALCEDARVIPNSLFVYIYDHFEL